MSYESAAAIYRDVLPRAYTLLPRHMQSPEADVMLLAIGLQESGMEARIQHGNGPARGLWQFEQGGGVRGVLNHGSVKKFAKGACLACGIPADPAAAWAALAKDDVLAAVFARLLLWTDAFAIPDPEEPAVAWEYYKRLWRPGKPHVDRWPENHAAAVKIVLGNNP